MSGSPLSTRAQVLIAVLGVLATLGAAAISNWETLFPTREPLPPPTPQLQAQPEPHDLAGEWRLLNTIESTTYSPFLGLELGYRLFLDQDGNRIEGRGEKFWEDGDEVAHTARTPITLSGTISGDSVTATCREEGARRVTTCRFNWLIVGGGTELQGTFTSTAANAQGTSVARRVE